MIKTTNQQVVFQEFPNEITLAINISNCPCHCPGCHSSYLAGDVGTELTEDLLQDLIESHPYLTCVGFMGGDADPTTVTELAHYIYNRYPDLKVGWYSGRSYDDENGVVKLPVDNRWFTYIKLGPYISDRGPLNNPNTNQRMYFNTGLSPDTSRITGWEDITEKFWK